VSIIGCIALRLSFWILALIAAPISPPTSPPTAPPVTPALSGSGIRFF